VYKRQEENAPESLFADLDDHLDADEGDFPETDAARNMIEDHAAEEIAPLVLGKEARVAGDPEPKAQRPLNARVVKMKKSEFEKAISQGVIEEEPDIDQASDTVIDPEALLSPEEEADLQRQLAEVEAELDSEQQHSMAKPVPEAVQGSATDVDWDDHDDEAPAPFAEAQEAYEQEDKPDLAAALREETDEAQEEESEETPRRGLSRLIGMAKRAPEDEERIFDKADSQMGDKDASMRRTAIQHLRAAVAATRAEKSAGVDVDKGVDETPYRSDLAQVVRPRRPVGHTATERPERPSNQPPAPLKLVAEQRVDIEQTPVRPRRVTTVPSPVAADPQGNFNEFAKDMGATELSDLLEAAAAYMSDVEGHTEFTRPMLMGKLKEVRQDGYSREDGLRSFGQLLRDGKLRKLKGGRFAATEETEFRAEARNVG